MRTRAPALKLHPLMVMLEVEEVPDCRALPLALRVYSTAYLLYLQYNTYLSTYILLSRYLLPGFDPDRPA